MHRSMERPLTSIGTAGTPEQRDALASPLRLEIFGHFSPSEPMSVREVAACMGRTPSSLYYHVHRLVDVGLLRRAGERPRGTTTEALYEAVGSTRRMEPDGSAETRDAILRTMAAAFRMAERDLDAALPAAPEAVPKSGDEPLFATRLHFRATPELLEEVRGHLSAALDLVERATGQPPPTEVDGSRLCSLTLALLPLRGRAPAEGPE